MKTKPVITYWNKSKDSSSVVKKTVVYKGETYHLTPSSRKSIDEKNMKKFLSEYPELIKEWHPTKNGDSKPEDFTHGSKKKSR